MEFEQIIKRLDWLDDEHRKGKIAQDSLSERLTRMEGDLKVANMKLADMSHFSTTVTRMEQYNTALAQQRKEITKFVETLDKKRQESQGESEKRQQILFENLNKSMVELRTTTIANLQRELKAVTDEETQRSKLLASWETRLQTAQQEMTETVRAQKAFEESRRQDSKRLTDLQGEFNAARKRLDEVREKGDVLSENFQRVELRLNEVLTTETDRRQTQSDFIASQTKLQFERDRLWDEWKGRLETTRKQTETMERNLQNWDTTQRALKRAQESYEEITQKFERRINEITEMQRLAEDRFRQEWVTFKADDQKRWSGYMLTQDETHKDSRSSVGKIDERLTALEDLTQTQQDILQQTKEANEQLFQGMLAQIHELLSAYERIMSAK